MSSVGLGSGFSIPNTSPNVVSNTSAPTTPADSGSVSSSTSATPPLFTSLPFERVTLSTLGLGTPLSSDDYSALIADLQGKLDKATKLQRDQRVNESAARTASILAAVTALKQQISDDTGAIGAAKAQQQVDKTTEKQYLDAYNFDVSTLGPAGAPGSALANASATLSNDSATLSKIPKYVKDSKGNDTTQLTSAWVNQNNVVTQDSARLTALQYQYQATQDYKSEVDANYRGDTQLAQNYAAAVNSDLDNARSALSAAGLSSTGYEGTVTQAEKDYDGFNAARVDYDAQQQIIVAKTAEVATDSVAIAFLLSSLATAPAVVDVTKTAVDHNLDLVRDLGALKTGDLVKNFSARMAAVIDRVALLSLLQDKPVVDSQPPGEELSVAAKAAVATLLAAVSDVLSAISETLSAGQYASQAALLNNDRVTIPG